MLRTGKEIKRKSLLMKDIQGNNSNKIMLHMETTRTTKIITIIIIEGSELINSRKKANGLFSNHIKST